MVGSTGPGASAAQRELDGDLDAAFDRGFAAHGGREAPAIDGVHRRAVEAARTAAGDQVDFARIAVGADVHAQQDRARFAAAIGVARIARRGLLDGAGEGTGARLEEHTSELQSPKRNPYAVFCWRK